MAKDVGKYVEGYNMCQRMKNRTEVPAGKLKLSEVLEKLWTHLIVDFITKLLVIAGKDAILIVYDRFSKMTHFVATTEGTSAERLARLFRTMYGSCTDYQKVLYWIEDCSLPQK